MARAPVFLALLCLVVLALAGGADARKMVGVYELKRGDFSVKMTNWGATIMSVLVPDSKGMYVHLLLSTRKKNQKILFPYQENHIWLYV